MWPGLSCKDSCSSSQSVIGEQLEWHWQRLYQSSTRWDKWTVGVTHTTKCNKCAVGVTWPLYTVPSEICERLEPAAPYSHLRSSSPCGFLSYRKDLKIFHAIIHHSWERNCQNLAPERQIWAQNPYILANPLSQGSESRSLRALAQYFRIFFQIVEAMA